MIFKKISCIEEMPSSCTECPLYPMHCNFPLENEYLKDGLDKKRDELCPLIEIKESDVEFFYNNAKCNRENSASLAELPEQKWKESHKAEVRMMDAIIDRLEIIKGVLTKLL